MVNADFVYSVDAGFASDLNVAFGTEYRKEEFDLFAGDSASFALGTARGPRVLIKLKWLRRVPEQFLKRPG